MSVGTYGGYTPAILGADYPAGPVLWPAGQSWPPRLPPRVYANDLNRQLSAAVSFLSMKPQFKGAQQVTAQSIPSSANTQILLDTEIDDAWGMHSNSGDTSQVVVPAGCDGTYLVQGTVPFAATAAGYGYQALIYYNGSSYKSGNMGGGWSGSGNVPVPQVMDLLQLSAGETFSLAAYHTYTSAVSTSISTAANGSTQFSNAQYPVLTARWVGTGNNVPGGVMSIPFIQGDGTWFANENVQLSVPDPGTWTSLQEATSSRFNSDILNSVLFLSNVPMLRAVCASTPAAIASGSAGGQVTGLSSASDNWSAYNVTTSTYTAPVNGLYLLMGQTVWPNPGVSYTGRTWLQATISGVGTTLMGGEMTGVTLTTNAIRTVRLSAGDTVQVWSSQNSGSSLTPIENVNTKFLALWLSA